MSKIPVNLRYLMILGIVAFVEIGVCQLVAEEPRPRLGLNLAGPCDWNTEMPFVDLMRFSRAWSSQQKGVPFGAGPALHFDENGYPQSLPDGVWAESPLVSFNSKHPWPSGQYDVFYKGKGRLSFGKSAIEVTELGPGHLVVHLDGTSGNLHLSILETDPNDPVRDIHVILPGFRETWRSNPWNPSFLARWKGVSCFRFMDFMATNNSSIRTWDERPTLTDSTFAGRGVPLELMIDLCNRLSVDPWFCIPHMATDGYVSEFADMVRDRLNPLLKVHIEYSNEVWNSGFKQHRYAGEKGMALGLAKEPWEAAWLYTSKRSIEIFNIFEHSFGGTQRLLRILPAQAGNTFMARKILEFQNAAARADCIAIALYVGLNVAGTPDKYNTLTEETVVAWDVPQVFKELRAKSLPSTIDSMRAFRKLAAENGLDLVAYEGGQHLVGIRGAENNATVTHLLHAANADPAMGAIYNDLFHEWTESGGSLFCHFSSIAKWTKWGSWGIVEYYDDDPALSPKFRALRRWAESVGQPIGEPEKQPMQ